jgi:proteic killer suppression protein
LASVDAKHHIGNQLTIINRLLIFFPLIKSFNDKLTAAVFLGLSAKRLPTELRRRAKDKLDALDSAVRIEDLRLPPSNRLEALKHGLKGQWSIRINDQWRVCFRFEGGDAFDVEITDYH